MQKKGIVFIVVVLFTVQCFSMDSFKDWQKPPRKKVKPDEGLDAEPPSCFRLASPSKKEESLSEVSLFVFDNDDDYWGRDFGLLSQPPPFPALYYLSVHDHTIEKTRTFSADTKPELLKSFLISFINEANTKNSREIQTHLYAKVLSLPIQMHASNKYLISCNAGGGLCRHVESAQSREQLVVQLFAHFVVEHCKNSKWYQTVSKAVNYF